MLTASNNNDDKDLAEMNKDYECICCGTRFINTSPQIVLTFVVTMTVILLSFIAIFTKVGDIAIFTAIIAGVMAYWLPSPTQAVMQRKDAVQNARLLQNNIHMNKMLMGSRMNH